MTHPKLFFSSTDVPRLRAAATSTHTAQFARLQQWASLYGQVPPIAPANLPTDRDTLQVYYENAAASIFNLALLYHLTDTSSYALAAETWLSALCSYPVETDGGYFIGAYVLALSCGYDLLFSRLSPSAQMQTRAHLEALLERGRTGTRSDWWAGLRLHHDHWLPAAGLCVGALALLDETAASQERLAFFTDHLHHAFDAVGDDGAWPEGAAHWNYAFAMLAIYFDARKHVVGENLFQTPRMKKTLTCRLYHYLPAGRYLHHHDSFPSGRYNVMGAASSHLLRKLAAELHDEHAQWLAEQDEPDDLALLAGPPPADDWITSKQFIVPPHHCVGWSFLWFDPAVRSSPPGPALPHHALFPNQGLVILRPGWDVGDSVFSFTCAPVGGHAGRQAVLAGDDRIAANIGHIHALAGAFTLWSGGNDLATTPGYAMPESAHQNTLTIEGCSQRLDPRPLATLNSPDFGTHHAYIAGEAAACYPPEAGLERWVRHVAWLSPHTFIIADELRAHAPMARARDTVWRMNYQPDVNRALLDSQASTFRIQPRDSNQLAALQVQFLAPSNLQLHDVAVRHHWTELPSSVVAGLRLDPAIADQKNGWIAFHQVTASIRDIFQNSPQARILAVLTTLQNHAAPPPARPIDVPHAMGAVIDHQDASQAAVFLLNDWHPSALSPLVLEISAHQKLSCLIFGLPPASSWDASCHTTPAAKNAPAPALHRLLLCPGSALRTTDGGSLTVQCHEVRTASTTGS